MINPILFLSLLPPDIIDEQISKIEKCKLSGIIKNIEIKKENECLNTLKLLVSGDSGYYYINVIKSTPCSIDGPYVVYGDTTLPKGGDLVDYLIDKNGYFIISDNKVGEGIYKLVTGSNSEGNTETCTPNSSFVEQNNDYLYFGIILCIIIITGIIINMILNKKKGKI